ncbi:unnamed protein product, partial [Coregonus sp. 'balchen']
MEVAIERFQRCRSYVYFALFRDNVDRADFQCSNCLLAEDYRGEVATLSKQPDAALVWWKCHRRVGSPQLTGRCSAGFHPPFSGERSCSRLKQPAMEIRHSPWKSKKASSGNVGLIGVVKPGPDTALPPWIGYGGTCVFVLCSVSLS